MTWYFWLYLIAFGILPVIIGGIILVTGIRIMRQIDEIAHGPRRRRR